jgi:hypothetical protein
MSSTYTKWVHRGEDLNVDVLEHVVHEDHVHADATSYVDVSEDDHDGDGELLEMLQELYTAWEKSGERPNFARVLDDAKHCPESKVSRFSFIV